MALLRKAHSLTHFYRCRVRPEEEEATFDDACHWRNHGSFLFSYKSIPATCNTSVTTTTSATSATTATKSSQSYKEEGAFSMIL
jgi:hypothetical protein